jgi:predicted ATP-grasp superfamily ATP-dependent carboligase
MSHRTPSAAHRPPFTLAIVGASTRAAAFSAFRAGWQPWCADSFADVDLRAICPVTPVPWQAYARELPSLLARAPEAPWIYTGALENRPGLVGKLAALRPLWGNGPAVLRRARQPWHVAAVLRQEGLACPGIWPRERSGPDHGRWLVKPLASAGGLGIIPWQPGAAPRSRTYLQELIDGDACAAVYVGHGEGQAFLLGVTRQLIGLPWLFAAPFQYCGSVGPLPLSASTTTKFARLGDVCATRLGLRGLFGVDCILRDEVPYPVEINPRYTASVEVLEHALGIQALTLHRQACLKEPLHARVARPTSIVGKAILFARAPLTVPARGPWSAALEQPCLGLRSFADIPEGGEVIERGQPVLTAFASASSMTTCLEALQNAAGAVDRLL